MVWYCTLRAFGQKPPLKLICKLHCHGHLSYRRVKGWNVRTCRANYEITLDSKAWKLNIFNVVTYLIWHLKIPTLQKPEIDETWIWKLKNQWISARMKIFFQVWLFHNLISLFNRLKYRWIPSSVPIQISNRFLDFTSLYFWTLDNHSSRRQIMYNL